MKTKFNGCKSFGCINLANPTVTLYRKTDQLGFDSYQCPECGSFTPILDDFAINQFIEHTLKFKQNTDLPSCPNCGLASNSRAFGKTSAGTSRRQCQQCHSVYALFNTDKLEKQLQPLLDLLLNNTPTSDVYPKTNWSSKVYYQRLSKLSSLLGLANRTFLTNYLNSKEKLTLITQSSTAQVRSGKQKNSLKIWQLRTMDAKYGYQIFQNDNVILGEAPSASLYVLDSVEEQFTGDQLFKHVQWTYNKIFSRSQFDNLGYAKQNETQTNEGSLLRPVVAAHTHFQILSSMLTEYIPTDLLLEHESFLRGSSIVAFSEQVKKGDVNLYYLYRYPSNNRNKDHQKNIGWWNETWFKHTQLGNKPFFDIVLCPLTKGHQDCVNQLTSDWAKEFDQYLSHKLPKTYISTISYKIYREWLEIFTYLYNFIFIKESGSTLTHDLNTELDSIKSLAEKMNSLITDKT